MADTLGSLIDKLTTVNLKMWNAQEILYEIRRMDFDDYKSKYFNSEDGAKILWDRLQKATDLNCQRNQLIDEIDEALINMIFSAKNSDYTNFYNKYLQKKHKTY